LSGTSLKRTVWYASVVALLVAPPSYAADLGYGGRLVDDSGIPLSGPVALTLRFFGSAAGSDQLGPTKTFPVVALTDGV
jgi:hypothetical protein